MQDKNYHKLIIIGCGASGMAAAISASKYEKDILILERNDVPGKKITATGNGKCNFTNLNIREEHFRSSTGNPFSSYTLFDNNDAISFFKSIGIPVFIKNGYCYPHSCQALSVRDALAAELKQANIKTVFNCRIIAIERKTELFILKSKEAVYSCSKLIVAAGGEAQPCFGTDGSFYYILGKLGHTSIKSLPALAGLISNDDNLKELAGVRQEAEIALFIDNCSSNELPIIENQSAAYSEYGEIIFNKNSVSGIPVMNSSSVAVRALNEGKSAILSLDFFPDYSLKELRDFISNRYSKFHGTLKDSMTGFLNDKLISVILKKADVSNEYRIHDNNTEGVIGTVATLSKNFSFEIIRTNGFDSAQVTSGGINLKEIDLNTFESKIIKDLYITGELLDVDAICGGYNLQWAWTSGIIAGAYAGGGHFDKNKLIKA